MSELCSEVLEGVFKNMKQKVGMISSEDLLSRLHNFNEVIENENLIIYNPEVQEHKDGSIDTVQMVASDVVALFPSMRAEETARVCSLMVQESDLEFQDLDYKEMLLYISLNTDKVTNIGYINAFLPTRAKRFGRPPTVRNKQLSAPKKQSDL